MQERKKVSIKTLENKKKKGEKIVAVTAYDYPQALLADRAGVDLILVGDSASMTTHGWKSTIPMTMELMMPHSVSAWRANKYAMLVADMPFLSYQPSDRDAIINAGRFMSEGGADCVKVEGNQVDRVKAISDAGIMVMAHLGLTPMTRALLSGYSVQGKTKEAAEIIRDDALRMQDAGARLLLLEAMPSEAAEMVRNALQIPVLGVGAGPNLDGQLVILHDLIGMFFDFKSKFVKRYCEAGLLIENALKQYASEVRSGEFPTKEHCYDMKPEELEKALGDPRWKYEKL